MKQDSLNKVWFIAGKSRGPARALAETALEAGASLVISLRPGDTVDDLVMLYGRRVFPLSLEVSDAVGARAAAHVAFSAFGRIDVLVDHADRSPSGTFDEFAPADLEALLTAEKIEVEPVTAAALPRLLGQGFGCVLQVTPGTPAEGERTCGWSFKPVELA